MPRRARAKSDSGIYHVVLRGINRQAFFEDEEDYHKFILTLKKCPVVSSRTSPFQKLPEAVRPPCKIFQLQKALRDKTCGAFLCDLISETVNQCLI